MSRTAIQWTEHSWNPVVGCSVLTPGCTNCYAMSMAARIEAMSKSLPLSPTGPHYEGTTKRVNGKPVWTGKLALAPERILLQPPKRKKPTIYFVNSMGDLFHEDCPDEWIDKVFAVMALSPQHTFQVLTKRAARMRDYFSKPVERGGMIDCSRADRIGDRMLMDHDIQSGFKCVPWPLPNVWLGVSTERQQEADERIPLLLDTPAAVRFISAEPLLGPVDLTQSVRAGVPTYRLGACLDWVIVGGESGIGARPMDPEWALSLRDQCQVSGVPFFFKQWGSHVPETRGRYRKVAKSVAGRLLDGVEHNAMPAKAVQS